MAKITRSKMMRRMHVNLGTKENPIAGDFAGYAKPQGIEERIIDLPRGAKMRIRIAPGQAINLKREIARAEKRGDIIYPDGLSLK